MRAKKFITFTLFATLALLTVTCGGAGIEEATPTPNGGTEGMLPTLHSGDRWVLAVTSEGDHYPMTVAVTGDRWVSTVTSEAYHYTMTVEVTGDEIMSGKDCYVVDILLDPPVMGVVDSATAWLEKAKLDWVKMETSGEYMSLPYIVSTDSSYEGPTLWPLQVGKEATRTETTTTISKMLGEEETETEKEPYTDRVERIEYITVPAGTFRCFKIIRYDDHGTVSLEGWYLDEVKQNVKEIDHEDGDTIELQSYSVR